MINHEEVIKAIGPAVIRMIHENPLGGWRDLSSYTLTYATATTVTVTGDLTGWLAVGTKIKYTQTTVKYGYITGVAFDTNTGLTTITINSGSDYAVADATITDVFISGDEQPIGFPGYFAYTVTPTGFSSNPTLYGRFSIHGRTCFVSIRSTSNGTSNATSKTASLPVTAAAWSGLYIQICQIVDNNVAAVGMAIINGAGTTIVFYKDVAGSAFTSSGNSRISVGEMGYEI